jgi:hypothetical protein
VKTCNKCGIAKALQGFCKDTGRPNGFRRICKACAARRQKAYNAAHRKQVLGYRKSSYLRNREKNLKRLKEWARKNRGALMIRGAATRAKQAGLPFDLGHYKKEIQARVDAGFCELTGLPFNLNGDRAWDTPSLDRIDPKKGYIYSNVRVVCRAINCALGSWGEEALEKVVHAWLARRR